MGDPTGTFHHFVSWARHGLAARVSERDSVGRAKVSLRLDLLDARSSEAVTAPIDREITLLGPGDVIGLDPRQIVRRFPRPNVEEVESNFMPLIEFDEPDLPWMFTPVPPDASRSRLSPWIVLIAVKVQPGVELVTPRRAKPGEGSLPQVLRLRAPASVAEELPDLKQSWAWAHADAVAGRRLAPVEVSATLRDDPDGAMSRLLCPRHLEPGATYIAAVVPAFEAGRLAGLGIDPDGAGSTAPAWTGKESELDLPTYLSWRFSTSPDPRDLDQLANQLRAVNAPPDLGRRAVKVAGRATEVVVAGALASEVRIDPEPAIDELLRSEIDPDRPGLLPAPMYGAVAVDQTTVDAGGPVAWLADLNLTVGHRIAAGLGAEVVRRNQEEFVDAAWQQLGEVRAATAQWNRSHLAAQVLERLRAKHVDGRHEVGARAQFVCGLVPADGRLVENQGLRAVPYGQVAESPMFRRFSSRQRRMAERLPPSSETRLAASLASRRIDDVVTPHEVDGLSHIRVLATAPKRGNLTDLSRLGLGTPLTTSVRAAVEPRSPVRAARVRAPDDLRPSLVAKFNAAVKPVQLRLLHTAQGKAPRADLLAIIERRFVVSPGAGAGRVRDKMVTGWPAGTRFGASHVMPFPELPVLGYAKLDQLGDSWILPRVSELLPPSSATIVQTNQAFVASFLAGMNVEMSNELLWREFPTDRRGSPFRSFWTTDQSDIPAIHQWRGVAVADAARRKGDAAQAVLVVRGELFRRYPDIVVYLVRERPSPRTTVTPIFSGRFDPDVHMFGFPVTVEELRGGDWNIVFDEQMEGPRFGLDHGMGRAATWSDLTWHEMRVNPGSHLSVPAAPSWGGRSGDKRPQRPGMAATEFGRTSAAIARTLCQQPVRVVLDAGRLLAEQRTGEAG